MYKRYTESWQGTARNIEFMAARMATDCKTKENVCLESLCPADVVNFVQLKNPKSTVEAANFVQDYLKRQGKDRPWSRGHYGSDHHKEKKSRDS